MVERSAPAPITRYSSEAFFWQHHLLELRTTVVTAMRGQEGRGMHVASNASDGRIG
jgi:hypothetical protein